MCCREWIIWLWQNDYLYFRNELWKILPKIIIGILKDLTMKGSWIPCNILSVKNLLITAKTQTNLIKIFIVFLIITHPEKKKCICGNNKPFKTKTYWRAFMQRTRFRNKLLKNPTEENKLLYNENRNFCVSSLRKEKKNTLQK